MSSELLGVIVLTFRVVPTVRLPVKFAALLIVWPLTLPLSVSAPAGDTAN